MEENSKESRISIIWERLFEHKLLCEGEPLHYDITIEGHEKKFSGVGTSTSKGIILNNPSLPLTPTLSLMISIKNQVTNFISINMINGWPIWRNKDGKTLSELTTELPEIRFSFNQPISNRIINHLPKRDTPKYINFFGAGASVGAGVPNQDQLLNNILYTDNQELRKSISHSKFVEFYKRFFCGKHGLSSSTLEELFGFLDFFILNKVSLGGKYNHQYISTIKSYLIRLMQFEIKTCVDNSIQKKNLIRTYLNLLLNIVSENHKTTFVTLNYDILLSHTFSYLYPLNTYLDYGIDITNYESTTLTNPLYNWINPKAVIAAPDNVRIKRLTVLKLHGSTNWKYCASCKSLFVARWDNLLDIDLRTMYTDQEYENEKEKNPHMFCKICQGRLEAMITPPTHLKDFTHPITTQLFKAFSREIDSVKKVVFIGYSFPEADIHIKALFSSRREPFDQVHIINPEISEQTKNRYKSISQSCYVHNITFDDFTDDISVFREITGTLTRS